MNTQNIINATWQSLVASTLAIAIVAVSFFIIEPQMGQAATSGPFTIKTTITDEISFTANATNVTATGSINGITGGTANGSTSVTVRTNSNTGYSMTIAFASNSTDNAMKGDVSGSTAIHDYPAVSSTTPTFLFSTASTSSVFGYTVSADAGATDLAQAFLDDGADCNIPIGSGGAYTADRCWMEPMTSAFEIIDRGTAAASGATSTIHFRVHVPNLPNPSLVADTYTATATLTAVNQ